MSRKQKKAGKKKRQEKLSQPKSEVAELNTRLNLRASLLGRVGITLVAPTILASYSLYLYFGPSRYQTLLNPTWADATFLAMIVFLMGVLFFTMSLDVTAKMFRVAETEKQKNLRHATVLKVYTITFTAIIYAIVMKQGYLDDFAGYLKSNIFPALSNGVNYVFSNIVAWAISGAIGNLFYDVMKRIFLRSRNKDHQQ